MGRDKVNYEDAEPFAPGMHFLRGALNCENLGVTVLDATAGWEGKEHDHTGDGQEEVYLLLDGAGGSPSTARRPTWNPATPSGLTLSRPANCPSRRRARWSSSARTDRQQRTTVDHIDSGRHKTAHEVRKRCKEIRAAVRLVCPVRHVTRGDAHDVRATPLD
jgi:hypothetical protein